MEEEAAELRKLGRDEYLRRSFHPLLAMLRGPALRDELLSKPLTGPLMRGTVEASAALAPRSRVDESAPLLVVRKRPGAAFNERIGIGRTANNDIVLPYAGVSKYHAYFTRAADGGWCLSDAGSKNGTFIGQVRVAEAEARPLGADTVIRIGPHSLVFLTPPAFLAYLENR